MNSTPQARELQQLALSRRDSLQQELDHIHDLIETYKGRKEELEAAILELSRFGFQ